jgi:hypothetical protein
MPKFGRCYFCGKYRLTGLCEECGLQVCGPCAFEHPLLAWRAGELEEFWGVRCGEIHPGAVQKMVLPKLR